MRTLQGLGVLVAVTILFSVTRAADDDALKAGLKALEGKWEVTGCLKDGEDLELVLKLGVKFEFKDDILEVTGRDKDFTPQKRFIKLDVSTTPKLLDVAEKPEELKDGSKLLEGVYSVDGETLKWCFQMDGDEPAKGKRPVALESKAGSGTMLLTLKKVK
ncbi:MAG: TIGR03067 domain-containing protein [Planctomycetales bacterium]|nr:TIGR03067 domain-containing protein [Planctomycetales bacterium]